MKNSILFLVFLFTMSSILAQYDYAASKENPYGLPNPKAPEQLKDYDPLIGVCECKSESRKPDGSWSEAVDMIWKWDYILNGMAVRDETLKSDGTHSGSIRQFSADSSKWYVHYYTSRAVVSTLQTWEGTKIDNGNIVLYRDQTAPNGTEGYFRLSFYDISESGYKWVGEWTDKTETVVYPTWKINCVKK